jgi:DNA-directed RNA polymerase I subunit RPA2
MVSDKFQVRTTGPIDPLTRQPVKGRKRAGGIRFGEMERDSLLAHGVSFCLQDRLMNCSDYSIAAACRQCGSVLTPTLDREGGAHGRRNQSGMDVRKRMTCVTCGNGQGIVELAVPYVFRYLATELMAMNIRLRLTITE